MSILPSPGQINPELNVAIDTVNIGGNVTVQEIIDPVDINGIADPVTVSSITDPVTVTSVTNPVTVTSVTNPVTVASVTNPVSVSSVTNPITVDGINNPITVTDITNPVVVTSITNPVEIGGISDPVAISVISSPVTVDNITNSIVVDNITDPVTVASITNPVTITGTLTGITNPVTVASITNPVTVTGNITGITNPITVASITNPVTIAGTLTGITNPVTVTGTLTGITNPVTVTGNITGITNPITVASITNPVTVASITNPVTITGTLTGITNPVTVTNTNALTVAPAAGPGLDAFARQRFSEPFTIFDSKQIFDNSPLFWDDAQISGSGTSSTYNTNQASTSIAVSNATAGVRARQTKMSFDYQPGKSQLIIMTGILGAGATGITKRIGYFDNSNGVFFQLQGTTLSTVIRSNFSGTPSDTITAQSSWNVDKMDGNGVSGITLDVTKAQIFFIDMEWLGVGRVRFGVFINGTPYYVHYANHANVSTGVYMSTPNLPLRYEISNSGSGGAATLVHICSTVISEGGSQQNGVIRSVSRGATGLTTNNNTSVYPVLSIRIKSTYRGATIIPLDLSLLCTSSADFRWSLILNPTVGGGDAASWVALSNSAIEYDISRTSTNTLTGGYEIAGGYGSANLNNIAAFIPTALRLGFTIAGVADNLVLAVQRTTGTSETFFGSLSFREIY